MKVILRQTLPRVGKAGQIVTVADGFARNFLFPRGYATLADKAAQAEHARRQAKLADEVEKTKSQAASLAEKLDGKTVRVIGNAGKGSSRLFGAVTDETIVQGVKDTLGIEVDRKKIAMLHPIKRLGAYDILIDLHPQVEATIKLEVANEDGWLGEPVLEAPTPALEAEATSPPEAPPVTETPQESSQETPQIDTNEAPQE